MPYTAEHKQATRERIIASARKLFNHRGFAEVSIDEVMAAAGLTRGGFYNHFNTKDELYAEAVAHVKKQMQAASDGGGCPGAPAVHGRQAVGHLIDHYLSRSHYDDVDSQCPMIALPSDIARCGPAVRAAFQEVVEGMAGMLAANIAPNGRAPRDRALALAALCVGGMVLARTVNDDGFADEIRQAARALAHQTIGEEGSADC